MVRRTSKELGETFHRARALFSQVGATFTGSPESGSMTCTMPGGARLRFAHIDGIADAALYQGHSYTRIYVEEIGNYPSPDPIMMLHAALRSAAGVPCRFRATGNPGGPGHQWVKARYISPAPLGMTVITDPDTELDRVFIPSKLRDNAFLGSDYVGRLKMSGSPELVRAWLDGDWDVVAGAFFPEFSLDRHVIRARALPRYWHRYRAFDWGSARPFACYWIAVSDGEIDDFPRGALIVYREWYGMQDGKPNVGLRMTAEQVADGIVEREKPDAREGVTMSGVADPAIFAEDGGPSIAQRMALRRCFFNRADNKRVPHAGAMGGWDQVRARLIGEDDKPMIYFFEQCVHLIRTLPALQYDADKPEDVDTDGEDHGPDAVRYGAMARPYVRDVVPVQSAPSWRRKQTQQRKSGWAA
jgi:hypothetical protein